MIPNTYTYEVGQRVITNEGTGFVTDLNGVLVVELDRGDFVEIFGARVISQ